MQHTLVMLQAEGTQRLPVFILLTETKCSARIFAAILLPKSQAQNTHAGALP